jgi:NADH-quinone oxidoreductase subunit E
LGIAPGETTADGRFTLLPVPCLGTCDKAPAMMVGEDLHTNVAPEKFETVLEPYK